MHARPLQGDATAADAARQSAEALALIQDDLDTVRVEVARWRASLAELRVKTRQLERSLHRYDTALGAIPIGRLEDQADQLVEIADRAEQGREPAPVIQLAEFRKGESG